MIKEKYYLFVENFDQLKNQNIGFALDLFFPIDIYSS